MDAVFKGLPVIVVEDWAGLAAGDLEARYAEVAARMAAGKYDASRLRLAYHLCRLWRAAMRPVPSAAAAAFGCRPVSEER